MSQNSKPQRIIFQPTWENSEKLKNMAMTNNMSMSAILNKMLDSIDESSTIGFDNYMIDPVEATILHQEFQDCWEYISKELQNNRLLPFSEATWDMEDYYDVMLYHDKGLMDVYEGTILPHKVSIYPLVQDKLIDDGLHHDIISLWKDYLGCMTFGVHVFKNENNDIINYSLYGIFFDKVLYRMFMECDDDVNDVTNPDFPMYELNDKCGSSIIIDCRKKGWHWETENVYFDT